MSSLVWNKATAPITWVSGGGAIGVNWNTPDREKSSSFGLFLDESVTDVRLAKKKSVSFSMGLGTSLGEDNIRDVNYPLFMGMGVVPNRQYTKVSTLGVSLGESIPTHNIEDVTLESRFGMSVGFNYTYTKTATLAADFDFSISNNMPTITFQTNLGQSATPNYQYTQAVTLTSYLGSTSAERRLWEPEPEGSTTWTASTDPSTTWTKVSK
jgi:hypothetical protein|tara:strand:+ start:2890 stop:3522 length:633 start_codon:yes stop_codon:yes gene_type:complete